VTAGETRGSDSGIAIGEITKSGQIMVVRTPSGDLVKIYCGPVDIDATARY
jgi:hypothetical protein